MRTLHIYCDGGFGNRFNGLVAGLLLAKSAGLAPLVVWPVNNWCGARYQDIFVSPAEVVERELSTFVADKGQLHFFMTEDHLQMGVPYRSPLATASLDDALAFIDSSDKDVFLHTPLIPVFLHPEDVHSCVRGLQFQSAIVEQANAIMERHRMVDYFGIHIRKTDFGANGSDDTNLFQLVKSVPHKQFFVCSDDAEVEKKFGALPNVILYPKRAYVEKLVDGNWNTPTADHSGRVYACNVNRNAISVEDAVVDLLVLSYSQIVSTSNSTFRNTALLLKSARHSA